MRKILFWILILLIAALGYFWFKKVRQPDYVSEDPRVPGLEDSIRQQRDGLNIPPKIDFDNIPRDGKG